MMRYTWKPYTEADAGLVDAWLDADAIRGTGLEEGWQAFYGYWMTESRTGEGKDRCFLISQQGTPIAVLYIAVTAGEMLLSEYIVAPDRRGKGHGAAILRELLAYAPLLLNSPVSRAKAVIYPCNSASIKAFEGAGFRRVSGNHDDSGDSLNYDYQFGADR